MKKSKRNLIGIGILGGIIFLSGCSLGQGVVEKAIESQTGGKVQIDSQNKSMTIKNDNGATVTMGTSKLPDNFPKDVFVYEDAQFILVAGAGENDYSVAYMTDTNLDTALAKYKEELIANGWKNEQEMDIGEGGKILNFKKENRNLAITFGTEKAENNSRKTVIALTEATDGKETNQNSKAMDKEQLDTSYGDQDLSPTETNEGSEASTSPTPN